MYTSRKSNLKNTICKLFTQHITLFDSFNSVYLFGSVLNMNKFPNDIDLLLIYDKYSNNIVRDVNFISLILEIETGLPVDLTALSIEEEKNVEFLKKIDPTYLKLK